VFFFFFLCQILAGHSKASAQVYALLTSARQTRFSATDGVEALARRASRSAPVMPLRCPPLCYAFLWGGL